MDMVEANYGGPTLEFNHHLFNRNAICNPVQEKGDKEEGQNVKRKTQAIDK